MLVWDHHRLGISGIALVLLLTIVLLAAAAMFDVDIVFPKG